MKNPWTSLSGLSDRPRPGPGRRKVIIYQPLGVVAMENRWLGFALLGSSTGVLGQGWPPPQPRIYRILPPLAVNTQVRTST